MSRCGASTASGSGGHRLEAGVRYVARSLEGGEIAEGENLEVDPPRRLVQSYVALWSEGVKGEGSRG